MKMLFSVLMMTSAMAMSSLAVASNTMKMNFNNEDLTKIVELYSKVSGQKFVMDASVRGKVSIFIQEPVALEEAFNQLSSALALNGYAISKQGDTMIIKSARNITRDLIEVSTEVPSLKPERMSTWVYNMKYANATDVNRELRMLSSKDGEMNVNVRMNQLIFTDWVSNIHRISEFMKQVDVKLENSVSGNSKKENTVKK